LKIERRGFAASLLTFEAALLGLAVGFAVVLPWTRGGYVLFLDWVSGPNQAITPGLYGLDPAALDAMPYRLATQAIRELAGPGATAWLMVLLYFPVAAGGASALAGGGRLRRYVAALVMVCNPFVVERIRAGHVSFLLSVALLPWLFGSAVQARRLGKVFAARPAGWYAMAMSVAPHAAWLGGMGLFLIAVLPRPRLIDIVRTVTVAVAAAGVYLYAAAVMLNGVTTIGVTDLDLRAYATRAGPGGLIATVASLHGFWRGNVAPVPRDKLPGPLGPIILAIALAAVVAGIRVLWKRDAPLGAPLGALALVGIGLGAGIDGPLGTVYRKAFDTLPLFETMREQQKWVALTLIAYAVTIGGAVEALVYVVRRRRRFRQRLLAAVSAAAISGAALSAAPALVWGLGGQIQVSHYPRAWYAADAAMGEGEGSVLFLPWHGYQPFSFTGGRTIATPGSAFLRRPVVASDSVEIGALRSDSVSKRIAYLDRLIANAGNGRFGRLVAPLGVEYVWLARDREAGAYVWLDRQPDLKRVLHTPELDLYRVTARGNGRVVANRAVDLDTAITLAGKGRLGNETLIPQEPPTEGLPSTMSGGIQRITSTRWRIDPGPAGWVALPMEWSAGWRTDDGSPVRRTLSGTVAVRAGPGTVFVEYAPWRWLRYGLVASLLSFAALVLSGLVEHRRALSGWFARRQYRSGAPPAPASGGGHTSRHAARDTRTGGLHRRAKTDHRRGPDVVVPGKSEPAEDHKRVPDRPQDGP
jgi:hypothetical protein